MEAGGESFLGVDRIFEGQDGFDMTDSPSAATEVEPRHAWEPERLEMEAELHAVHTDKGFEFWTAFECTVNGHTDKRAGGVGDFGPWIFFFPTVMSSEAERTILVVVAPERSASFEETFDIEPDSGSGGSGNGFGALWVCFAPATHALGGSEDR